MKQGIVLSGLCSLLVALVIGLSEPITAQEEPMATTVKAPFRVEDVWAKPSLKGTKVGVVFMTIVNSGDEILTLAQVSTPAAKRAELHTHVMNGEIMRMEQVEEVRILPQSRQVFEPGGLHVMLFDLNQPLKEGDRFPMTLTFDRGTLDIVVPVEAIIGNEDQQPEADHSHHSH